MEKDSDLSYSLRRLGFFFFLKLIITVLYNFILGKITIYPTELLRKNRYPLTLSEMTDTPPESKHRHFAVNLGRVIVSMKKLYTIINIYSSHYTIPVSLKKCTNLSTFQNPSAKESKK